MIKLDKNTDPKLFEALYFVSAATGKNFNRKLLSFLYVEPWEIAATDGHRLHVAYIKHQFPAGYYEVSKRLVATIHITKIEGVKLEPLDYKAVIASCKEAPKTWATLPDYKGVFIQDDRRECFIHYAKMIRAIDPSVTIDFDFFMDAIKYTNRWCHPSPLSPVIMHKENLVAYIMPLAV